MIVDHLNTSLGGGAAIAARRVHESLRIAGVDSRFWHARSAGKDVGDPNCRVLNWTPPHRLPSTDAGPGHQSASGILGNVLGDIASACAVAGRKIKQKYDRRRFLTGHPPELEYFSLPRQPRPTRYDPAVLAGDVLHLHWIAKFIDYPSFFASLPKGMPVVWTLHDMAPMTGGCHYTMGCEAFATQCRCCPLLGRPGENDLARRGFDTKLAALRGLNLHVVANSRWTERQARRSRLLAEARSFQTIHYGLDTRQFSPRDKRESRRELGLPDDRVVVAFGAESIDNVRKGLRVLMEALSMLPGRDRVLGVFFGRGRIPAGEGQSPKAPPHSVASVEALPELRSVGYLHDPTQQRTVYSAADVFVIPSLEEAFGQTGIEAMACGTPVVGFDTGGIPDFVRPMQTGLLAKAGDAVDLARQIQWLVDRPQERKRMGSNARAVAVDEFRLEIQAAKYVALYESLVNRRRSQPMQPMQPILSKAG
jgi:glycosyltransferase involved in cell wall biosynthesis